MLRRLVFFGIGLVLLSLAQQLRTVRLDNAAIESALLPHLGDVNKHLEATRRGLMELAYRHRSSTEEVEASIRVARAFAGSGYDPDKGMDEQITIGTDQLAKHLSSHLASKFLQDVPFITAFRSPDSSASFEYVKSVLIELYCEYLFRQAWYGELCCFDEGRFVQIYDPGQHEYLIYFGGFDGTCAEWYYCTIKVAGKVMEDGVFKYVPDHPGVQNIPIELGRYDKRIDRIVYDTIYYHMNILGNRIEGCKAFLGDWGP